jgi:hypothetical protein
MKRFIHEKGFIASVRTGLLQRQLSRTSPASEINKTLTVDIGHALNSLLAEVVALFKKTTNCY